ncbi:MAG: YigZ family protein [Candidatus Handelsmanbacteria bacterium]|nr:YigZ family protein [Candidatus Handelsmanbacteria bacterium]
MTPGHLVPGGESRTELRIGNSRFIGTAGPAATVGEVRALLARLRGEFPDASHHAYAFAVGVGARQTHGMRDDGEPSGTAGRPMLAVVQGSGLGDVVVVATRYFVGSKLGTGGLVRAYSGTAKAVLAFLATSEKVATASVQFSLPYEFLVRAGLLRTRAEGQIETEPLASWSRCRCGCARTGWRSAAWPWGS